MDVAETGCGPRAGDVYPEPHEGIAGCDRTGDDLLHLDAARRRVMVRMGRCLYDAVRVGNRAPVVETMHRRMSSPRPGDLVVEASGLGTDDGVTLRSFGILLAVRTEWTTTAAEYQAEVEGEHAVGGSDFARLTDTAWYIQYGPAADDVCRWVGCSFVGVLPDGAGQV